MKESISQERTCRLWIQLVARDRLQIHQLNIPIWCVLLRTHRNQGVRPEGVESLNSNQLIESHGLFEGVEVVGVKGEINVVESVVGQHDVCFRNSKLAGDDLKELGVGGVGGQFCSEACVFHSRPAVGEEHGVGRCLH